MIGSQGSGVRGQGSGVRGQGSASFVLIRGSFPNRPSYRENVDEPSITVGLLPQGTVSGSSE